MLREVILSSVGAKISMAYKQLERTSVSEVRKEGSEFPKNFSRVCCMTGQKGHTKRPSGLFQLAKYAFNSKITERRFVARPDKSLSTTGRTLCQELFIATLVFFNA